MTDQAVVRLVGNEGLLSGIPVLLGFHPQDALVLCCLQGTKVQMAMRISLDSWMSHPYSTITSMANAAKRHADQAILIGYGTDQATLDEVADRLVMAEVPLINAVLTGNEQRAVNEQLHAETVGLGRVVALSRDVLPTWVEFNPDSTTAVSAEFWRLMADSGSRDRYLARQMATPAESLPGLLAQCQAMPDRPAEDSGVTRSAIANACTVAAALAYRSGDGALANACVDRALRLAPEHSLAGLVGEFMRYGMRPALLDDLIEGLRDQTE